MEEKYKLLALFFANCREDGHPQLDVLFDLYDKHSAEYQKYRHLSFTLANIKANEYIITYVLSDDFKL